MVLRGRPVAVFVQGDMLFTGKFFSEVDVEKIGGGAHCARLVFLGLTIRDQCSLRGTLSIYKYKIF
jgi:hypothetical protein